jgi:hypothetical protein
MCVETEAEHFGTVSAHKPHDDKRLRAKHNPGRDTSDTLAEHVPNGLSHEKIATGLHTLPADLAAVVNAWATLPDPIKAGVLAMVRAADNPAERS